MKLSIKLLILIAVLPLSACSDSNTAQPNLIAGETAGETAPASFPSTSSTPAAVSDPSPAASAPDASQSSTAAAGFDAVIDASGTAAAPHYGYGMHPVCEQYFQAAQNCFAHAPEQHSSRLLVSLQESRAELMDANDETCRMVKQQFDEWAQTVNCR